VVLFGSETCDLERVVISPAVPLAFERHFFVVAMSSRRLARSNGGQSFWRTTGNSPAGLSPPIPSTRPCPRTHDSRSATIRIHLVARHAGHVAGGNRNHEQKQATKQNDSRHVGERRKQTCHPSEAV